MRRILAGSISAMALVSVGWRTTPAPSAPAQAARSYVLSDGKTAGTESFTRTGTSLKGDLTIGKNHAHYEGQILPNGTVSRMEVRGSALTDRVADRVVVLSVGRDSATMTEHGKTRVATVRVASTPGMVPVVNPSMALCELVVQYARARHAKTVVVPLVSLDELVPAQINVTFLTPTTVMLGSLDGARDQLRLVIDADGHIVRAVNGADAKDPFTARLVPSSK